MNDYKKFSIITDTQIQDNKYIHKLCNYTKSELDNLDISITQNQLNIINFIHMTNEYRNLNISDIYLNLLLEKYIKIYFDTGKMLPDQYTILGCYLTPTKILNYIDNDRKFSETLLTYSHNTNKGLSWIIRPSSFKGNEYMLDDDKKYISLVEYYTLSYYNISDNKVHHILIEKFISNGYSSGILVLENNNIQYNRTILSYNFLELLNYILRTIQTFMNIKSIDTSFVEEYINSMRLV